MIHPPGYRLPEQVHIGRVKLQVADLLRSLTYYQDVIGLKVLNRSGHVATLGPQGEDTPLLELHERRGASPVPRRGLLGLYHFAILLPDRASLGRFLQHIADLGLSPGMSDHLVSEAIYLQDPDNLGIEVYIDRPRSEWKQQDGQIAMATIPLDVPAVLHAGAGTPWTGAPAGTRI